MRRKILKNICRKFRCHFNIEFVLKINLHLQSCGQKPSLLRHGVEASVGLGSSSGSARDAPSTERARFVIRPEKICYCIILLLQGSIALLRDVVFAG